LPQIKGQFPEMQDYYPENFYHHHGLRFIADPATLNYIKDKDILDIGAFIGDSLVVLRNYTSGRVISYELAPGSYQKALKWASNNSLVFNMGISDAPGTVRVRFKGGHGSNLNQRGVVPVPVTTVDDEVERLGLNVGMIKADVENFELNSRTERSVADDTERLTSVVHRTLSWTGDP
jgi:FkbM family methyltransferase